MEEVQGTVNFEPVQPVDLLDAARSIEGRGGEGRVVAAPGDGPDKPLGWAVSDIKLAGTADDRSDRDHLATNAILNARRALACLVDWYLRRDCFALCKDAPSPPRRQAALLEKRRIIDELTSRVLERAIQKRNTVEHEYISPQVETAEDVVELLRRTIESLRNASDPQLGPCLFGSISYGVSSGREGPKARFYGYREPCFLFCTFDPEPWAGVILPESNAKALVRRSFLKEIQTETLYELLSILEHNFGRVSGYMSDEYWRLLGVQCGLL